MSNFEGLLNPAKAHLHSLPDDVFSYPDHVGESKQGIMIIPLFETRPGDTSLEHHIVKSAVWARRSWLLFTDAIDLDIPIRYYADRNVKDRVLALLDKYGANTDRDVLFFDGGRTYGDPMNHLGHKLSMFNDNQFKDYDWVWQLDSDAFFASNDRSKFPYFEKLLSLDKQLSASEYYPFKDFMTYRDMHWYNFLLDDSHTDADRQSEWVSRAKSICDASIIDKYLSPGTGRAGVGGGLYGFPAKQFLRDHKDLCRWIMNAGKIMQDDEAVFSLLISKGQTVMDLTEATGVKVMPTPTRLARFPEINHYISHFGRLDYEYEWRDGFDSIKRSQDIQKWYFSNLEARPEKSDAQELVSILQGFPPNVLQRFPASLENDEVPDSLEEICELMVADGFTEWHYDAIKVNDREPSNLAADWTKLRMLRNIINNNENAVLTSDSAYLLCKFSQLQSLVKQLPDSMNALYLHWEAEPDDSDHVDALSKLKQSGVPGVLKDFCAIGWIIYFTVKGAKLFYDLWRQMPSCDGQAVMYYAAQKGLSDLSGFYACNPQIASAVFNLHEIYGYTLSSDNALILKDKGRESFHDDTMTLKNNRNRSHTRHVKSQMPKNKAFLSALPPLPEPVPSYPCDSKKAIMLIPIMEGGNNALIHDHIVQSSIWARRSWVLFSDAQEMGIPIKYYVDDSEIIRDDVMRVFNDNHVDVDNEVIWSDMSMFPSDKIFSKKHKIFNDETLSDYKWVYPIDSDFFLASKKKRKFPFFSNLIDHAPEIGVTEIERDSRVMMCSHYFNESVETIIKHDVRGYADRVKVWLETVFEMTGHLVYDKYLSDYNLIPVTKMPIIAFPARHFLRNRPKDCRWWEEMGKLLGHDEETSAIWSAQNEPLWEVAKEVGLRVVWWGNMTRYPYTDEFYLSHAADTSSEYKFREDIDAL